MPIRSDAMRIITCIDLQLQRTCMWTHNTFVYACIRSYAACMCVWFSRGHCTPTSVYISMGQLLILRQKHQQHQQHQRSGFPLASSLSRFHPRRSVEIICDVRVKGFSNRVTPDIRGFIFSTCCSLQALENRLCRDSFRKYPVFDHSWRERKNLGNLFFFTNEISLLSSLHLSTTEKKNWWWLINRRRKKGWTVYAHRYLSCKFNVYNVLIYVHILTFLYTNSIRYICAIYRWRYIRTELGAWNFAEDPSRGRKKLLSESSMNGSPSIFQFFFFFFNHVASISVHRLL